METHNMDVPGSGAKSVAACELRDVMQHGIDQRHQPSQAESSCNMVAKLVQTSDGMLASAGSADAAPSETHVAQPAGPSEASRSVAIARPRRALAGWIDAAKSGDAVELRKLWKLHPELLNQQAGGLQCTAAHWAAANGHPEALSNLLAWGADITITTATGCLPLHSAAAAGRADCVHLLLTHDGNLLQRQLETQNEDGLTPAALALCHGHKVVQGMLLQATKGAGASILPQEQLVPCTAGEDQVQTQHASAEPSQQLQQHHTRQHDQTGMRRGFLLGPLHQSSHVKTGSDAPPQQPTGKQSISTVPSTQPVNAQTPDVQKDDRAIADGSSTHAGTVMTADDTCASQQQVTDASPDVAAQPDPDVCPGAQQQLPTTVTAHDSKAQGAATGQQQQAIPKEKPAAAGDLKTRRSWLDAARAGNLQQLQQLLQQDSQLLDYGGTGTSYAFVGNSALHWAAAKGHTTCVSWLLQQGASVSTVNEAGASPLHTAVEHGQADCAQVLVLLGAADVQLQDGYGQTALALAAAGTRAVAGSSSGSAGCGVEQLLLWHEARTLKQQDRSLWGNVSMLRLLQLAMAGKAADAAKCLEKSELVTLTTEVLKSVYDMGLLVGA